MNQYFLFCFVFVDWSQGSRQSQLGWKALQHLSALTADAAGQLDVLGHDGHTLGVDGAEVSVLEKANEVSLRSLLEGGDGRALEAEIRLEILGDLTNEPLEGELAKE